MDKKNLKHPQEKYFHAQPVLGCVDSGHIPNIFLDFVGQPSRGGGKDNSR